MRQSKAEERFAEELLRRVLGIEVTQRDDGSADRMPDLLFRLPGGGDGALEVTTIGLQEAIEREAIAASTGWNVPGASWRWVVYVGPGVLMQDLKHHLSPVLLACERWGVRDPRWLSDDACPRNVREWLLVSDVSMHGFPETSQPGLIDVLSDEGVGGFVREDLDELPGWLSTRLREPDVIGKIQKLRDTGREELHLFLRIHDTAMPFYLYDPLAFGGYVPTEPLDPPIGLTALWLAPAWKNPILWWHASTGWKRTDCRG